MWCCFLANPQNLDIKELLDVDPKQSPFARALGDAKHVVVVPNRTVSIYTRLWCVYEAFLAVSLGKRIHLTSRSPFRVSYLGFCRNVLTPLFLGAFAVLVTCLLSEFGSATQAHMGVLILNFVVVACAALMRLLNAKTRPVWIIQILSLYAAGVMVFGFFYWVKNSGWNKESTNDGISLAACGFVVLILAGMYELERSHATWTSQKADMLEFTSVREAACTSSTDSARIWAAIEKHNIEGDSVADVDRAINVLKQAGSYDEEVGEYGRQGFEIRRPLTNGFRRYLVLGTVLWSAVLITVFFGFSHSLKFQDEIAFWCGVGGLLLQFSVIQGRCCNRGVMSKVFGVSVLVNSGIICCVGWVIQHDLCSQVWSNPKTVCEDVGNDLNFASIWFSLCALVGAALSILGPLNDAKLRRFITSCLGLKRHGAVVQKDAFGSQPTRDDQTSVALV